MARARGRWLVGPVGCWAPKSVAIAVEQTTGRDRLMERREGRLSRWAMDLFGRARAGTGCDLARARQSVLVAQNLSPLNAQPPARPDPLKIQVRYGFGPSTRKYRVRTPAAHSPNY